MNDLQHTVIVTDLKQFAYCQRVVFYERCLPRVRPRTYKMDAGKAEHERERGRAARRTLSKTGIPEGIRFFDVHCESALLQCSGIVDEVIETPDGTLYPVDYKMTKNVSGNHHLQLAAYALLLETVTPHPIHQGFIYLTIKREIVPVKITEKLKQTVRQQLEQLRDMIAQERMPPPTTVRNRCINCEFRRFCNDID